MGVCVSGEQGMCGDGERDPRLSIKVRVHYMPDPVLNTCVQFSLHLQKLELLFAYLWRKRGTEWLSYLPKVTQPVCREVWTQLEPCY